MNQPVSDFIITNLHVSILNSDFLSFFESYFTQQSKKLYHFVLCVTSVLHQSSKQLLGCRATLNGNLVSLSKSFCEW